MESVRVCLVGQHYNKKGKSKDSKAAAILRTRQKSSRAIKQCWYDDECKAAAKVMHASIRCTDDSHKRQAYNNYRMICRRKRDVWLSARLTEVDRALNVNKSNMWQTIDHLLGISEPSVPQVDVDRLRDHYCRAFNLDISSAELRESPAEPRIPTMLVDLRNKPHVTKPELEVVLKSLRRGKAAGIDGMKSDV